MKAPVTYQGGKQRIADQLLDVIGEVPGAFYDLCCGSGAVSIALVRRGVEPSKITMVDLSPWGLFWQQVGDGSLDLAQIEEHCAALSGDPDAVKTWAEAAYNAPVPADPVPIFLMLQAAAIGGCPVRIQRGKWVRTSGFRGYWKPTATSSRRYPVNPMMPMPQTLLQRVRQLSETMRGVRGVQCDVRSELFPPGTVYIDPPYRGVTAYGPDSFDVTTISAFKGGGVWVSEGRPLSESATKISGGRAKGGVTGTRRRAHEEWLSYIE